jgi:methionine biosynthesis protein MetW
MKHFLYLLKRSIKDLYFYPELRLRSLSYDEYWQNKKIGGANSFQKKRADWILGRVANHSTVLDMGCGDGSVLRLIKDARPIKVIGADASEFILKYLKEIGVESFYFNINDSDSLESIENYDHILLLEVLEHMASPEDFLVKVLDKVNKSVFISVPNTGHIQHRLRLLFGKFPLQWRSHPSEHLRYWTKDDFHWWIKSLGFEQRSTVHLYEGVPVLNNLFPSLFARGIIAEISTK